MAKIEEAAVIAKLREHSPTVKVILHVAEIVLRNLRRTIDDVLSILSGGFED